MCLFGFCIEKWRIGFLRWFCLFGVFFSFFYFVVVVFFSEKVRIANVVDDVISVREAFLVQFFLFVVWANVHIFQFDSQIWIDLKHIGIMILMRRSFTYKYWPPWLSVKVKLYYYSFFLKIFSGEIIYLFFFLFKGSVTFLEGTFFKLCYFRNKSWDIILKFIFFFNCSFYLFHYCTNCF